MSNHVTSLLRRKRLGVEVTGKAIILLMGDLASDDGSGIWASKPTMAAELETTPRTIQRQIHKLIEAGFVTEVGTRRHRNGDTIEYRILVEAVEKCPDSRQRPPTQRRPSTQHVDGEAQDMTPDTVSPLTERHPTPDTPSGEPLTQCRPNQNKPKGTHCAPDDAHTDDFCFEDFFEEFRLAYPRLGDLEATDEALRAAIVGGADPAKVLAGAKAYGIEQQGNKPQYIAYSENWVAAKRWRQHVTAPKSSVDPREVLKARAADIKARKPWVAAGIKVSQAGECIQAGLVTVRECREAGINV